MIRIISLILILAGLVGLGAIASIFFMGTSSPIAAIIEPYICKAGTNLVEGDGKPMFEYTVPLKCDDPDSLFDSDPSANLFQVGIWLFSPFAIGVWLLRISARWQAAGDYSRAMGYTTDFSTTSSIDVSKMSDEELSAAIKNMLERGKRGEISMQQMNEELQIFNDEYKRRASQPEARFF